MSDHAGADGEGQGAPSGTGSQASPGTPAGSRPEGFDPSRMALLPMDDGALSFNDSVLPSVMIWAGGEVYDDLTRRNALLYDGEDALDLDDCAIAVGIYRAMTAAATKALRSAQGGEAAQAAETCKGSAEGEHPVAAGQAPDPSEIPTLKTEIERLTQICTGLGLDLRIAEGERDDARTGEAIWALRCGVVIGRSPIPDAPADLGRLPAETFWRAARVDHIVRWEDRTFEERQRWAYAEGACIEKARSQVPEVQSLVAEIERLSTALAESERKRVEAESRAAVLSSALTMLGSHVVDPVVRKAIDDILARTTPTQETGEGQR